MHKNISRNNTRNVFEIPMFVPNPLVRNPHVQTMLASAQQILPFDINTHSREIVLNLSADGGTRLQGFYSPQPAAPPKGLVVMFHGWLGSANSSYNRAVGGDLFQRGYSVFRLNLRDHGGTEAWNEAPFHGARLEEVVQAVTAVGKLEPDTPLYVLGYSMGGNFALRVALHASQSPIPSLRHVIAVSPSIDPKATVEAIDTSFPLYSFYFGKKWHRMIRAKKAAFPHLYSDFDEVLHIKNSYEMGEWFITRYTEFPDSDSYYHSYAVTPAMMKTVTIPTTIITSKDDPIIPIADFEPFRTLDNPNFTLSVQPFGGHVAFMDILPIRRWLVDVIEAIAQN